MKKEFIGFYDPTDVEIKESWDDGYFIFDTNALLNLYRYTEDTRNDFIGALTKLKDRIHIPYRVALEFLSNRLTVIQNINSSYNSILESIDNNFEKNLKSQILQFKKHPTILVDNILKLHKDFYDKVAKELEKQKKNHPNFSEKDDILDKLTSLFEDKTGKEFSNDELKKIYAVGKERYEQLIPPGFKDLDTKKKKGERHVYGDYIIWKELIDFINKEKKPLVFITDDRKEDWWTIENGKTIRPREELIKEFYDVTGIRILIYNADNFLQFAKEKQLVPEIKDKTIEEIKDVRKSDELRNNLSDIITYSPYKIPKANTYISEFLKQEGQNQWFISDYINSVNNQARIPGVLSFADMARAKIDHLNPSGIDWSDYINSNIRALKSEVSISDWHRLSTLFNNDAVSQSSILPSTDTENSGSD